MKRTATFGILGLLLVGLVTAGYGWNSEARTSIENNDYGAWREARMGELTEENFQMHRNRQLEMGQHREEMDAAITKGYDAWNELMDDRPCSEDAVITEGNFGRFQEMHEAMQNGEFEEAEEIREELGLPARGGRGIHKGMGMRK